MNTYKRYLTKLQSVMIYLSISSAGIVTALAMIGGELEGSEVWFTFVIFLILYYLFYLLLLPFVAMLSDKLRGRRLL